MHAKNVPAHWRLMFMGLCLIFCGIGCSKNRTERSVWYINGKKYTSRNTKVIRSNNTGLPFVSLSYESEATGNDYQSWGISFSCSALPQSGSYSIRNYNDTDKNGLIVINYKRFIYTRSSFDTGTIRASNDRGQAKFEIAPVWMVQYGGTDSFLFSGVFYEPLQN